MPQRDCRLYARKLERSCSRAKKRVFKCYCVSAQGIKVAVLSRFKWYWELLLSVSWSRTPSPLHTFTCDRLDDATSEAINYLMDYYVSKFASTKASYLTVTDPVEDSFSVKGAFAQRRHWWAPRSAPSTVGRARKDCIAGRNYKTQLSDNSRSLRHRPQ